MKQSDENATVRQRRRSWGKARLLRKDFDAQNLSEITFHVFPQEGEEALRFLRRHRLLDGIEEKYNDS